MIYSTPHEAAEKRVEMASMYATMAEEMKGLKLHRAKNWVAVRKQVKSDKQADQEWDMTKSGLREIELKYEMKALERQMSACASYQKNAEHEYWSTPRSG